MTKCASCGASAQDGKYCEECGKGLGGAKRSSVSSSRSSGGSGSSDTSSVGASRYIMAIGVAVAIVVGITFLSTSFGQSGGTSVTQADVVSSPSCQGSSCSISSGSGNAPKTTVSPDSSDTGSSALPSGSRTLKVSITGMTCGSCVARIEGAVSKLAGVASVDVTLSSKSAVVVYDPAVLTKQKIIETITATGYPATEVSDAAGAQAPAAPVSGSATGGSCGGSSGSCGGSGGSCGGSAGDTVAKPAKTGGCGCGG